MEARNIVRFLLHCILMSASVDAPTKSRTVQKRSQTRSQPKLMIALLVSRTANICAVSHRVLARCFDITQAATPIVRACRHSASCSEEVPAQSQTPLTSSYSKHSLVNKTSISTMYICGCACDSSFFMPLASWPCLAKDAFSP